MGDMDELFRTVESLRSSDFPDVPAEVVAGILDIEARHVDDANRGAAPRLIEALVDESIGAA